MPETSQPVELRAALRVCKQLDCSLVTIWRRVHDPSLNFPQPVKICGRNYFRADEIDAWIEAQTARRCDDDANNDNDDDDQALPVGKDLP